MPEKLRTAATLGLRFLFLTRYSWMLALTLVALPPFALLVAPSLLENLFVFDRPVQMFHVSWIAMFCAASVIGTLRITALNAIDRFEDYRQACADFHAAWKTEERVGKRWYHHWEGWLTLIAGLATAIGIWYVIMAACVARTVTDPSSAWGDLSRDSGAGTSVSYLAWREAIYGAGLTIGILSAIYILVAVHQHCLADDVDDERPFPCSESARSGQSAQNSAATPGLPDLPELASTEFRFYQFLAVLTGPGYFREVNYRCTSGSRHQIVLAPGHAGLMLSTALFLGWYAFNYWSVLRDGKMPDENSVMPALFFGLLSLLLVILILPGISFLLDRHRIPILPTMLLVMAAFYGVFRTDHYFELNPPQSRAETVPAKTIDAVYEQWKLPVVWVVNAR